jgi:4-carboxymuconolactone decarboxylase
MADDGYDREGLAMRRRALGDEYVDLALQNSSDFTREFQQFITRYAWGEVWTRPGMEPRTRSLLTIALLAALGREEELKLHVRATANTGATPEEIREALFHVAVYAGVPAANTAFRIANQTLREMGKIK